MNLSDHRLYESKNLEDFSFRFYFQDDDNRGKRLAVREVADLSGFVSPDWSKIVGLDISDWDGNVNLAVSKQAGFKFVFIKAIDGTVPAKYFSANNQMAIAVGLMNGSYGWLYPDSRVSCVLQARAYWDVIKNARLKLPPVIDFEWTKYAGIQANPNYLDLEKWVNEFIRVSGKKPILYSAAGYMNMFGKMPADLRGKFAGFWWASYGGTRPLYPMGFDSYDTWQFSAEGEALLLAPGDRNKKELLEDPKSMTTKTAVVMTLTLLAELHDKYEFDHKRVDEMYHSYMWARWVFLLLTGLGLTDLAQKFLSLVGTARGAQ